MGVILSLFIVFATHVKQGWARVRHLEVDKDQIVTVRTSLGIATIIQVPDRPNSVVVGDQQSFKVEYLDEAITIKPLNFSAKSNLYINTDFRRYNVQLITGNEAFADYVVYLKHPHKKSLMAGRSEITWTSFQNSLKNESLKLSTTRLGRTKDGYLLVEFRVETSEPIALKPEWIWLTQKGQTKTIHTLNLSTLQLNQSTKAFGFLMLNKSELNPNEPFRIELRLKRSSYLTVKETALWN